MNSYFSVTLTASAGCRLAYFLPPRPRRKTQRRSSAALDVTRKLNDYLIKQQIINYILKNN